MFFGIVDKDTNRHNSPKNTQGGVGEYMNRVYVSKFDWDPERHAAHTMSIYTGVEVVPKI